MDVHSSLWDDVSKRKLKNGIDWKKEYNKTNNFKEKRLSNAVSRLECPLLVCKYKIISLPNQKDLNINPKLDFSKIKQKNWCQYSEYF